MSDTILVIHDNLDCYANFVASLDDFAVSYSEWSDKFNIELAKYGGRFVRSNDDSEFWLQFGNIEGLVEFKLRWS